MAGKKTSSPQTIPPPGHLSDRGKALWASVVPRRARSPERLAMVQAAIEALDRADGARQLIANEGLTSTTTTTGAVHVHPLVKVEREARAQFLSAWAALSFQFDASIDGRTDKWPN